ncbi:helix-turn-helix domain-containing protein [Phytoactinopolyspora halotolerans]|uniref:helix-turn-helix domain-containing protein n=1 Tax=Phytoactinopolyspora halotolerans TaxID=1981512 RepID=UPI001C202F25|nr:helix-turn-helix domain-containing protein [Phytoactinopolyspora halotolerans]
MRTDDEPATPRPAGARGFERPDGTARPAGGDGYSLTPVGVGEFDEHVYRTLLTRTDATPADLAEQLGSPPARVDRAFARLRSLGLVTRMSGRHPRYTAVDPEAAVESLVRARSTELEQVRSSVLALSAMFHAVRRQEGAGGTIEVLNGPEELGRWFVRLQHQVRDEMLALDRPPYALAAANPVEPLTLDAGVRWRAIYAPESLEIPGALQEIESLGARGEQSRVLAGLPMKLAIADRRIALLPLHLDVAHAQAAVIRESTLLDALVALFEFYWKRAVPIGDSGGDRSGRSDSGDGRPGDGRPSDGGPGDGGPGDGDEGTADDRELARLLASGLTDSAIARQLGLSTRTMRRRTRRLFDELAASNRFQAGVQAARRGWL